MTATPLAAIAARLAMVDVLSGDPDAGLETMSRLADEARQNRAEEVGVTAFRDTAVMALRVMDYARAEAALAEGLRLCRLDPAIPLRPRHGRAYRRDRVGRGTVGRRDPGRSPGDRGSRLLEGAEHGPLAARIRGIRSG